MVLPQAAVPPSVSGTEVGEHKEGRRGGGGGCESGDGECGAVDKFQLLPVLQPVQSGCWESRNIAAESEGLSEVKHSGGRVDCEQWWHCTETQSK